MLINNPKVSYNIYYTEDIYDTYFIILNFGYTQVILFKKIVF